MKDLLSNTLVHCDQQVAAGDSDAASSDNGGVGVRFDGYQRVVLLGSIAAPSGTSDGTAVIRLQYSTLAGVNTASDLAASDYTTFSTDAATASLAFATSDLAAGEGIGIVDVDLGAHGLTTGCVRAQIVLDGTNVASGSAWILLSGKSGIRGGQEHTVVTFP